MLEECLVVEFRVVGDDCPVADATRVTGGLVEAHPPQRRADGNSLLRFSVSRDDDATIHALDVDDRIRYLHVSRSADRQDVRCLSKHRCVVHRLVDAGFLVDTIRYRDGTETYEGAVVGRDVLRGVLDTAGETLGVTLSSIHPLGPESGDAIGQRWGLSPAQEEALQAAYRLGYFNVPRDCTASDVADTLGISKSAFLERLRRGLSAMFSHLLDTPRN